MRRAIALLCISLLLACQSGSKSDHPAQYRAWCWSKSRPLGDWTFDRAVAEEQMRKHDKMFPHHNASIKVWRGDPGTTEAK